MSRRPTSTSATSMSATPSPRSQSRSATRRLPDCSAKTFARATSSPHPTRVIAAGSPSSVQVVAGGTNNALGDLHQYRQRRRPHRLRDDGPHVHRPGRRHSDLGPRSARPRPAHHQRECKRLSACERSPHTPEPSTSAISMSAMRRRSRPCRSPITRRPTGSPKAWTRRSAL